jgi:hypothetical protein
LKEIVERNYNRQNPKGGSESCALEVVIDIGATNRDELDEWKKRKVSPDADASLKAVLVKSSDAFVTWRYLHEHSGNSKLTMLTYEYLRLDLVAHLLRDFAVKILHNKSLNRTRGGGAPPAG